MHYAVMLLRGIPTHVGKFVSIVYYRESLTLAMLGLCLGSGDLEE